MKWELHTQRLLLLWSERKVVIISAERFARLLRSHCCLYFLSYLPSGKNHIISESQQSHDNHCYIITTAKHLSSEKRGDSSSSFHTPCHRRYRPWLPHALHKSPAKYCSDAPVGSNYSYTTPRYVVGDLLESNFPYAFCSIPNYTSHNDSWNFELMNANSMNRNTWIYSRHLFDKSTVISTRPTPVNEIMTLHANYTRIWHYFTQSKPIH